ncbi:hypothetical protein IEO21_02925 [Rhodonia placenta]|uniref:BTB domain-containing protein n=1 Tax=Rhodonia placenta TaxID=104341 RepID=A0A8H7P755_9APHY|nr:hypothetical protein IEO21_02925 [Postia placenta]
MHLVAPFFLLALAIECVCASHAHLDDTRTHRQSQHSRLARRANGRCSAQRQAKVRLHTVSPPVRLPDSAQTEQNLNDASIPSFVLNVTSNVIDVQSACGPTGATPTVTPTSGPNGNIDWLNCGVGDGGWRPPFVTANDIIAKDLDAALLEPGSPFTACSAYVATFKKYATKYGVPPILVASIAMQESTCNANTVGGAGEQGLMQLTQDKCGSAPNGNCRDVDYNIKTGTKYFSTVLKNNNGNILLTLGNYNGWPAGMTYYLRVRPLHQPKGPAVDVRTTSTTNAATGSANKKKERDPLTTQAGTAVARAREGAHGPAAVCAAEEGANLPQNMDNAQRVDDLWYDDGSVVLIAQDRAFRVHRSILSQQSSVFRDMFSIPQSSDVMNMDGCPIVELADDALMLEHLLRAIYNRSFFLPCATESANEVVRIGTSIASLSHKYDIPPLMKEAIVRLEDIYSTKFEDHNRYHVDEDPMDDGTAIFVINATRRIAPSPLDRILPVAFYYCRRTSQLPMSPLVYGIRRGPCSPPEKLSDEDLARVLHGKSELELNMTLAFTRVFLPLNANFGPKCSDSLSCRDGLNQLMRCVMTSIPTAQILADCPDNFYTGLCAVCREHVKRALSLLRRKLWGNLKALFAL